MAYKSSEIEETQSTISSEVPQLRRGRLMGNSSGADTETTPENQHTGLKRGESILEKPLREQFSAEMKRILTQITQREDEVQKMKKALNGTKAQRKKLGQYWVRTSERSQRSRRVSISTWKSAAPRIVAKAIFATVKLIARRGQGHVFQMRLHMVPLPAQNNPGASKRLLPVHISR